MALVQNSHCNTCCTCCQTSHLLIAKYRLCELPWWLRIEPYLVSLLSSLLGSGLLVKMLSIKGVASPSPFPLPPLVVMGWSKLFTSQLARTTWTTLAVGTPSCSAVPSTENRSATAAHTFQVNPLDTKAYRKHDGKHTMWPSHAINSILKYRYKRSEPRQASTRLGQRQLPIQYISQIILHVSILRSVRPRRN